MNKNDLKNLLRIAKAMNNQYEINPHSIIFRDKAVSFYVDANSETGVALSIASVFNLKSTRGWYIEDEIPFLWNRDTSIVTTVLRRVGDYFAIIILTE